MNTTTDNHSQRRDLNQQDNQNLGLMEREMFLEGAGKYENLRITRNVCLIGIAFMLHFTAFHGTANLQSSINASDSLGTYTLAAIYGSLILSNIFLPVAVIRWFGCKWTIALSFIAYMPFIIAQFVPRLYTLIPAGLAVGLGGGPLWCAKCTYLTVISEALVTLQGKDGKAEGQVVRFFGLFFIFYQMAQVWGNLISSSVLAYGQEPISENVTVIIEEVSQLCGANFCPGVSAARNPNLQPPDMSKIHLLSGIFLFLMICACLLVAIGVDPLKRYEMGRKSSGSGLSGIRLLAVTVKQLLQWKQILLLPITMFIGAEQAFITVDFTSSFIACGSSISRIGYVMICFGIANAFAAGLAGAVAKLVGRNTILIFTLILHAALLIWMKQYMPVANDFVIYYTMAALWGLVDGIWLVLINSYYGILFPGREEAAFSNFRLFEASGSVIFYSLSPRLCTDTKLTAIFALMCIGMTGYGIIQYIIKSEETSDSIKTTNYKQTTNGSAEH